MIKEFVKAWEDAKSKRRAKVKIRRFKAAYFNNQV